MKIGAKVQSYNTNDGISFILCIISKPPIKTTPNLYEALAEDMYY